MIEGKDDPAANKKHQKAEIQLDHAILSPINVGVGSSNEGHTEDWAVVRDRRFQGRSERFQRQCHRPQYPHLSRRAHLSEVVPLNIRRRSRGYLKSMPFPSRIRVTVF